MKDLYRNYVSSLTNVFYVLLIVGFIVISIFPEVSGLPSTYFTIPFRTVVLLLSGVVIIKNILDGAITFNAPVLIFIAFWMLYSVKVWYSFENYSLPEHLQPVETFQRILLVNFVPALAVIINRGKDVNYEIVFRFVYVILCCVVFLNVLEGPPVDKFGRSHGIHSMYSISFGHVGVTMSLLSAYLLLFRKLISVDKFIAVVFFFAGVFLLYKANTRNPIIALSAGLILMFLAKRFYKGVAAIFGVAVAAVAGLFFLYKDSNIIITGKNPFLERVYVSIFEGDMSKRDILYLQAFEDFTNYPILGKSFLLESGFYPHNIYLEVMMAMGMLGLLLIIYLHFSAFRKLYFFIKNNFLHDRMWIGVLFLQYYILSLTSYNIYGNSDVWFYFAMLIAINLKRK